MNKLSLLADKTVAQVALKWLLQTPPVTSVLAGSRTPSQLESNIGAATAWRMTAEEVHVVRCVYLNCFVFQSTSSQIFVESRRGIWLNTMNPGYFVFGQKLTKPYPKIGKSLCFGVSKTIQVPSFLSTPPRNTTFLHFYLTRTREPVQIKMSGLPL